MLAEIGQRLEGYRRFLSVETNWLFGLRHHNSRVTDLAK